MKARAFWGASFFIFLTSFPLAVGTEGRPRVWPLPLAEVEILLCNWLVDSGFEVTRASLGAGQIQVTGVKRNERWQMRITPHSALASVIIAQYTVDGQPDSSRLEPLWAFLNHYVTGSPSAEKGSGEEIPKAVLSQSESVVCIKAKAGQRSIQFSGFIIDPKGWILSTAHDLKNVEEMTVLLPPGREVPARLARVDPERDLSLIHTSPRQAPSVSLGKGKALLKAGEKVYALRCSVDQPKRVYPGIVDGPLRQPNNSLLWLVDMETQPGSSGSPVFDSEGTLVGMVKGRYRGTDSVGFLIPVGAILEFLKEK